MAPRQFDQACLCRVALSVRLQNQEPVEKVIHTQDGLVEKWIRTVADDHGYTSADGLTVGGTDHCPRRSRQSWRVEVSRCCTSNESA